MATKSEDDGPNNNRPYLSLMARINSALGKTDHSTTYKEKGLNKQTALVHGEAKSETESDEESDIDDNVSLLECARIQRRLSNSPMKGRLKGASSLETCTDRLSDEDPDFPIVMPRAEKYGMNRNITETVRNELVSSNHLSGRLKSASSSETCSNQVSDEDPDFPIVMSRAEKYGVNRNVTETVRNELVSSNHSSGRLKSAFSSETCSNQLSDEDPDFPIVMSRAEKYGMHRNVTETVRSKLVSNNHLSALYDGQSARDSDHVQNSAEDSSSKGKSKEEKEREKVLKRQAKEMEKQSKEAAKREEKQRKLDEKESKKKKQEQEKVLKKAASMTAKADSMDQCLKHITAVVDTEALTDGGAGILQGLENMGVQYEVKKLPVNSTIGWMRDSVTYAPQENGQITRNSNYEEQNQILMRIKAANFSKMVEAQSMGGMSISSNTVLGCIEQAERLLPNKKITILVTGMNAYTKVAKAKAASKRTQGQMPMISKPDLEDVLLRLELQYNCCVHFCESSEDLAQMVCSFTKAVAEKPYKKTVGVALNMYLNNHEKGLPRVTKDGHGLLEVWSRQLQQFKGVGYDTAAAIVQKYPSPLMLSKDYEKCSSSIEASLLLQDIEVRRGHGVLATSRRVGPELSKKIHTLLTSVQGDAELAKS